jgi:Na+-transporting methylmalonyl-CoA/oxaloacetate decarboxylase gamma subunit
MVGANGLALVTALYVLGALVLAVLWFFLPFAVFGMKALVREAIGEARKANELLQKIADQNHALVEQQKLLIARSKPGN